MVLMRALMCANQTPKPATHRTMLHATTTMSIGMIPAEQGRTRPKNAGHSDAQIIPAKQTTGPHAAQMTTQHAIWGMYTGSIRAETWAARKRSAGIMHAVTECV